MNTVAVSAAVSAVVTVVVGTMVNWGERIVTWARRRATPDHLPITSGSGWLSTTAASSTAQVRVLVCCAPNRSLRRREVNPDCAIRLVRSQFTGMFPDRPVFSIPEHGVRFESEDGAADGYAWAHAGGRVDLCVTIPTTGPDPGPISISVLDVVAVLLRVARSCPQRLLRRRVRLPHPRLPAAVRLGRRGEPDDRRRWGRRQPLVGGVDLPWGDACTRGLATAGLLPIDWVRLGSPPETGT